MIFSSVKTGFEKPKASRGITRTVNFIFLIALSIGMLSGPILDSLTDVFFWILLIPSFIFFIRSFVYGLRIKHNMLVYRGFFVTRRVPLENILYFATSWDALDDVETFLHWEDSPFDVPCVFLNDGTELTFNACFGMEEGVEKKVDALNERLGLTPPVQEIHDEDTDFSFREEAKNLFNSIRGKNKE